VSLPSGPARAIQRQPSSPDSGERCPFTFRAPAAPPGDQTRSDRPRDEEDDGLYRTFSRAKAAVWDRTGPVYDADERQLRLAAMPKERPPGTLPYEVCNFF
jgi:hypothetical protein